MMAAIGGKDFILVMSAWGIRKGYLAESGEEAKRRIYEALNEGMKVIVVEEKYYKEVYEEVKVIRSENPDKTFIVSFIPGPELKGAEDPISRLMREAIGFEIRRG